MKRDRDEDEEGDAEANGNDGDDNDDDQDDTKSSEKKKQKKDKDNDDEEDDDDEEEDDDDDDDDDDGDELKFAVVCSSNMNRSMEAHKQFKENGLDVTSFGVGNMVRLPAPGGKPLSFSFDTPYSEMKMQILQRGELQWYRDKGLLGMLDRNIDIKDHPERFQDHENVAKFKIIFCFEERVYDILVKDLRSREPESYTDIHVLNLDVKDDTKEAVQGAAIALDLCKLCIEKKDTLEESLPEIIKQIEEKYSRPITHMTHYL